MKFIFPPIIFLSLLYYIFFFIQVVPHGSVATDSRECSEIGTSILKAGGNAVDAAIASAFCLALVNPHITGLDAYVFWQISSISELIKQSNKITIKSI